MKKILFSFAILFLAVGLSACTGGQERQNNSEFEGLGIVEQSPSESSDNLLSGNGSNIIQIQEPQGPIFLTSNNMRTLDGQTDLAQEYSQAIIKTSLGNITVKFYSEESPITVNNFLNLAQSGFYSGTKFHRVMENFMIQGGDPNSKGDDTSIYGTGGPEYRFADEINNRKLVLGSLAMANAGPNTNGSQFFIVVIPETPWLDGAHTNFGEVVAGMDVVEAIKSVQTGVRDIPLEPVVITGVELVK